MRREYFTMNPAHPHPDDTREPEPWPLDDAIAWALRVLRDPNASQWSRIRAADELQYSHESQEQTK